MIFTELEIQAPPNRVRESLLDLARIPAWHSGMIKRITPLSSEDDHHGGLAVGNKLHCEMEGFTFDSTITTNDNTSFAWQGPPVFGVVAGLHTFSFEPSIKTPGATTFVQKEAYTGLLAFAMSPSLLGRSIKGQFEKFNQDIKAHVENS